MNLVLGSEGRRHSTLYTGEFQLNSSVIYRNFPLIYTSYYSSRSKFTRVIIFLGQEQQKPVRKKKIL